MGELWEGEGVVVEGGPPTRRVWGWSADGGWWDNDVERRGHQREQKHRGSEDK